MRGTVSRSFDQFVLALDLTCDEHFGFCFWDLGRAGVCSSRVLRCGDGEFGWLTESKR